MTDDLRLRTAFCLGRKWHEKQPEFLVLPNAHIGSTVVATRRDGVLEWADTEPDPTTDLGACQEVLDAIAAREWEYKIVNSQRTGNVYVTLLDPRRVYRWQTQKAPTLPAAICLAFVQAVEAGNDA